MPDRRPTKTQPRFLEFYEFVRERSNDAPFLTTPEEIRTFLDTQPGLQLLEHLLERPDMSNVLSPETCDYTFDKSEQERIRECLAPYVSLPDARGLTFGGWVLSCARAFHQLHPSSYEEIDPGTKQATAEELQPQGDIKTRVVVSYHKAGERDLKRLRSILQNKVKVCNLPEARNMRQWTYHVRERAKKKGWWDSIPEDLWKSYK